MRRGRALRRRYGRAEAKGPMASFRTAARKVEKMIADFAAGGNKNETGIINAINKLDDRTNKAEIRGDDAIRAEAWATVSAVRAQWIAAQDTGRSARSAMYHAETAALKDKERERIANMSPGERATWQYQQELKLLRGGR
jgi:hypothetical protein